MCCKKSDFKYTKSIYKFYIPNKLQNILKVFAIKIPTFISI